MYEFFFSYARDDSGNWLTQFHDDLTKAVRREAKISGQEKPVSFWDKREIKQGSYWEPALESALQASKVMVAVCSPGYFRSEYCGKEWEFFRRRCATAGKNMLLPPLVKPVFWLPYEFSEAPADVAKIHHSFADSELLRTKGLEAVLKRLNSHGHTYWDYIDLLAEEIVQAGKEYPLAQLGEAPLLNNIPSAWEPAEDRGCLSAASAKPGPTSTLRQFTTEERKRLKFVYVAADPGDIGNQRRKDAYEKHGAGEWRPFYPGDDRSIDPLVMQVASRNDILLPSIELAFDKNLITELDRALELRQIVIIVIDPWTLYWHSPQPNSIYTKVLRELDKRIGYHWSILVPEADEDCNAMREQIHDAVRSIFQLRTSLFNNPLFYRDRIRSADELQQVLAELLMRLKAEINRNAPVLRPIAATIRRPVINGSTEN